MNFSNSMSIDYFKALCYNIVEVNTMILTKTFTYRGKQVTYEQLKPNSKMRVDVQCDNCGKVFTSWKFQLERNGHQLCQQCALKLKQEKPIPVGTKFGRFTIIGKSEKTGYSECLCECGTRKTVKNTYLRGGYVLSCGCLRSETAKLHAEKYLYAYQHEENHPNWKGGISPERNRIEKTSSYRAWKESVLSNAGYRCQKCGSSENIETHHIKNFSDYPEFREVVSNGACLCRKCHKQFHSIYGLKFTNEKQFAEFMNS